MIGGPSPDLTKIIFNACKRKGLFLTFVPSRHPKGKRREKEGDGELQRGTGVGQGLLREGKQPQRPPRTYFFVPSPFKFFKSSKQQEGQWSSLYRVISSVSGKDQSSESCSSKGGREEKENGRRKEKTPWTNFRCEHNYWAAWQWRQLLAGILAPRQSRSAASRPQGSLLNGTGWQVLRAPEPLGWGLLGLLSQGGWGPSAVQCALLHQLARPQSGFHLPAFAACPAYWACPLAPARFFIWEAVHVGSENTGFRAS